MNPLKHELAKAFRASSSMEPSDEPPAQQYEQEEIKIEAEFQPEDAAFAQFIAQIDGIEIGNWVEFRLVNGANFRCKLSVIIEEADCFVFVNRMGLKVIEKTRVELAHEMQRGRMTLLEQGAFTVSYTHLTLPTIYSV